MIRLSTNLVNFLQAGGSFKEALEDSILRIYSGSQPSSADSAPTGTLLVEITKDGNSFNYGTDYSNPQIDSILVTGNTGVFTVTINSVDVSYTASGGDTADSIAKTLARLINKTPAVRSVVRAVYVTSATFVVFSETAGESYTITTTGSMTKTSVQAASRSNGLLLNGVSDGVLTKNADTWQGAGITTGIAGWFRLSGKSDTYRIDGNVGTYGADLNLSSVNITQGVPIIIGSFTITQPKN